MTVMTWTDDRVATLKKLWEAGLSASQIAAELGHITRNAVIGKVHRLGLSGRTRSPASAAPRQRKVRPVQQQMMRPRVAFGSITPYAGNTAPKVDPAPEAEPAFFDNVVPLHQRLTLMQLTDETCKWPIGNPQDEDFFFCGGRSLGGMPYCAHHCRIGYQPLGDPRRKRRDDR